MKRRFAVGALWQFLRGGRGMGASPVVDRLDRRVAVLSRAGLDPEAWEACFDPAWEVAKELSARDFPELDALAGRRSPEWRAWLFRVLVARPPRVPGQFGLLLSLLAGVEQPLPFHDLMGRLATVARHYAEEAPHHQALLGPLVVEHLEAFEEELREALQRSPLLARYRVLSPEGVQRWEKLEEGP